MHAKLLSSVAVASLTLGMTMAAPDAKAFDVVDWEWTKDKQENVYVNKWIWGWFTPSGEVQVEKLQIFVGDVTAHDNLQGDFASQVVEGGEVTVPIDQTVSVSIDYTDEIIGENNDNQINEVLFSEDGVFDDPNTLDPSGLTLTWQGGAGGDQVVDEADDGINFSFNISGDLVAMVEPVNLLQDAVDHLGHATQTASATGIVDLISSPTMVSVHEGQYLMGDLNGLDQSDVGAGLEVLFGEVESGNQMHDLAGLLMLGVAGGYVEKAEIDASATAGTMGYGGHHSYENGGHHYSNPVELAIDQNVQATGAVAQITLDAWKLPEIVQTANNDPEDSTIDTGDTLATKHDNGPMREIPELAVFQPYATDLVVEADITQFAYADVSATASSFQDLTSFNNLGAYDRLGTPGLVANQVTQATGLVGQITVTVPTVEVPNP